MHQVYALRVQMCDKVQTLNIWDVVGTGAHTTVGVSGGRTIQQARTAPCAASALPTAPSAPSSSRDDTKAIFGLGGALNDPNKIVVVQVAPAVRAAWGEDIRSASGDCHGQSGW